MIPVFQLKPVSFPDYGILGSIDQKSNLARIGSLFPFSLQSGNVGFGP